jgi:REP element-mobilizing transposase RayT
MVLAVHLVWTCYGWWFPNDIRGSWSKEVWAPALQGLGTIDKRGRELLQPSAAELGNWLSEAQERLKHQAVILDTEARRIVRDEITAHSHMHNYATLALAVMPEHVHIVVGRHEHGHRKIVQSFKSVSSRQLRKYFLLAALPATRMLRAGVTCRAAGSTAKNPAPTPVWSRGYWVRFLNTNADITAAVAYMDRQAIAKNIDFFARER